MTTGADIPRLREELATMESNIYTVVEEMEKQQQRLFSFIEEIRQKVEKVRSTTVNVSSPQCPGEFIHRNPTLGSCYFIGKNRLRRNDAAKDCIRRGSYLAEIQSQEENDYLASLIYGIGDFDVVYGYWIGGYRNVTENVWVWENSGERFTYTNSGQGNCLLMQSGLGNWDNHRCIYWDYYICEMKGQ